MHGLREGSRVTVFLVAHPRHQNSNGPMFLIVARMCFRCSPFVECSEWHPCLLLVGPVSGIFKSELIASVLVNDPA